jgi:hypothetical protein
MYLNILGVSRQRYYSLGYSGGKGLQELNPSRRHSRMATKKKAAKKKKKK